MAKKQSLDDTRLKLVVHITSRNSVSKLIIQLTNSSSIPIMQKSMLFYSK